MPLSKEQRNETPGKAPVKLTRAERKEIQAVIRRYKGDGKPHSAQESIPYEAMYQDGVCRVTPNTFSKCIEFADISYQLAQADTKTAIFENLCDLYNYLDASIHVQFSFLNRKIDPRSTPRALRLKPRGTTSTTSGGVFRDFARPACERQQRPDKTEIPDVHH